MNIIQNGLRVMAGATATLIVIYIGNAMFDLAAAYIGGVL